jgi:VWFA-related protein
MKIFTGSLAVFGSAAVLLGSALFLAQDFQLRTKIDLVVVPVSVRDQNGALVENLKQNDFTILEDNKPQTISNFSTEPQPLSAAIIMDTEMTGAELRRLKLVVDQGDELIRKFHESDEFAAYRYDHTVTKLTDFTRDPQEIRKSFESVWTIAASKPADSEPGAVIGPSPLRAILDRTQIGTSGPPQDATRPTPVAPKPSTNSRPTEVSRVLHDAIFTAAMDLEKRPASQRKIILLISNGEVSGTNQHSQGETASRLYADGIQFYAVGTEPQVFAHFSLLNSYSRATGGATFEGKNELSMANAFGQVVEQARYQYMLGYRSSNEVPGTRPVLRKIDVKVGDKKLRVTHRQNYLQYPN